MDYEYDYDEPYEGRVLWGRIAVYGLAFVLVFILGSCFGGRGGGSEVTELQDQIMTLSSENETLENQLAAVGRDDPEMPSVTPSPTTPGPGGTPSPGATGTGPAPADGSRTYIVQSGDSLSSIAISMYGDAGQFELIAEANGLTEDDVLQEGQELTIPPLE